MSEINVDSRTQRLLVAPSTRTVSVINAGPAGPGVGGGPGTEGATLVYVDAAVAAAFPTGSFIQGGWATDPPGFLILDGTTVINGAVDHATLASLFPSWVSGNDLVLPDATDVVLLGSTTAPGVVAGSMTHTLSEAQLPSHSHDVSGLSVDIDHGHADNFTADQAQHRHTIPNHSHDTNVRFGFNINSALAGYIDVTRPTALGDAQVPGGNDIFTNSDGGGGYTSYTDPAITISGGVTDLNQANEAVVGTLGSTGSGSSIDHTPKHMTVKTAVKT